MGSGVVRFLRAGRPELPVAVPPCGMVISGGGLFVWYADRIQSGVESRALQRAVGFGVIFGGFFCVVQWVRVL